MTFTPGITLTNETAAQELAGGLAAIEQGQTEFTFGVTTNIDSSAVACMLAWKRQAIKSGIQLKFDDLPENLTHLIHLYGVTELLNNQQT